MASESVIHINIWKTYTVVRLHLEVFSVCTFKVLQSRSKQRVLALGKNILLMLTGNT